MKTIKVYVFPSHQTKERTSGVDFARVIQPMTYLNGYSDGEVKFEVTLYDINKEPQDNWIEIADQYDVLFMNYTIVDWPYAFMAAPLRAKGKKIICDVDDAIWYVQPDNSTYQTMKEKNASYVLECILNDVDGVVTTNGYLRNMIVDKTTKYHENILVAPNQVDLTKYSRVFPAQERSQITLMHFGATGHFDDLLSEEFVKGMDKIMNDYPNVRFKTVGSFVPNLKYKWGARYDNDFGDIDIYKWIENRFPIFMDEADIMVVPLRDTKYNRCKSSIKFREASSAMKPGVFSATRPYIEDIKHGETGYLAETADDWYKYLKILIDSVEERRRIGTNAYNYVKQYCQMKDNVNMYASFIKKILEI